MRRQGLERVRIGGQNIGVADVGKDRRTDQQGDEKNGKYLSGSRHWLNEDRQFSTQFQEDPENTIDSQTPK